MNLVPYWRRWHKMKSVRWNALTLAFGGSLAAYGTALHISPTLVQGIPQWVLTALVAGTMLGPVLSSLGALTNQTNLQEQKHAD